MGLRKDFLEHKKNTVESFSSVSNDISNLHVYLNNLKSTMPSVESRLISVEDSLESVRSVLDKCINDVNLQKSNDLIVESTIRDLNNSVSEIENIMKSTERRIADKISSFDIRFKVFASYNTKLSKKVTSNTNSLKKLLPRSKNLALQTRKLGSGLRESQDDARKLRNHLNRKLRSVKRADLEMETKIKSQRRRIAQLNSKIELKAGRRVSAGKGASRRVRKTTAGKARPKRTEVYKVIREKKSLI